MYVLTNGVYRNVETAHLRMHYFSSLWSMPYMPFGIRTTLHSLQTFSANYLPVFAVTIFSLPYDTLNIIILLKSSPQTTHLGSYYFSSLYSLHACPC